VHTDCQAFRLFDEDETGFITLENLMRVSRELGETMSVEVSVPCLICLQQF
jgi:Ca2+-binding EF-hand superfamily protein